MRLAAITDAEEKRRIISVCDDAFTISVTGRDNYEELFDKIDKRAAFIGAYMDSGEIAGYCAIYDNDLTSREAYITLFCVRREMQRMHLGSALMDASVAEAAAKGMKTIKLEVLKRDTGAIEFYKHNKFVITGSTENDSYYMKRDIRISERE